MNLSITVVRRTADSVAWHGEQLPRVMVDLYHQCNVQIARLRLAIAEAEKKQQEANSASLCLIGLCISALCISALCIRVVCGRLQDCNARLRLQTCNARLTASGYVPSWLLIQAALD